MEINENYLLPAIMLIFALALLYLKHDVKKIAESNHVTRIYFDNLGEVEIISKPSKNDTEVRGSKTLLIMYSLTCRNCSSDNIFVELNDSKKDIIIQCNDCGHILRIPIEDIFKK